MGDDDGFQFSARGQVHDCQSKCVKDLCPQWLSSLFSRVPKIVEFLDVDSGKATIAKIRLVHFGLSDLSGHPWSFEINNEISETLKTLTTFDSKDIAEICRLFKQPRKNGTELEVSFLLKDSILGVENMLLRFPEFESGSYFIKDNSDWEYHLGRFSTKLQIAEPMSKALAHYYGLDSSSSSSSSSSTTPLSRYYAMDDFNDPSICRDVDTKNLDNFGAIEDFLNFIEVELGEGVVKPTSYCSKTLSTIANADVNLSLPDPNNLVERRRFLKNQVTARNI